MFFVLRIFLVAAILGIGLFAYIEKSNHVTRLRITVPQLSKKLKSIEEENARLLFTIEQFENPVHLMQLARKPEFSHLKYPINTEVIFIEEQ
jgi:hypothetical protein